jgi:hypothetical protein
METDDESELFTAGEEISHLHRRGLHLMPTRA